MSQVALLNLNLDFMCITRNCFLPFCLRLLKFGVRCLVPLIALSMAVYLHCPGDVATPSIRGRLEQDGQVRSPCMYH